MSDVFVIVDTTLRGYPVNGMGRLHPVVGNDPLYIDLLYPDVIKDFPIGKEENPRTMHTAELVHAYVEGVKLLSKVSELLSIDGDNTKEKSRKLIQEFMKVHEPRAIYK